ncbi:hypothetical protein [Halomonas sp. DWK9]|uniref:hypothetical protein n=1 Tax=Halomonas sp. DWK9 TaxID=3060155 RepID=UPI00287FE7EF|nr:hypothetical protein [Halomonas sp. DWK9]
MKAIPLSITCLLALAGCQTVPDRLPQAEPAPAAACYFPTDPSGQGDTLSVVTDSIDVLEAWGFALETTDTELGLVSASREQELIGYYDRYDYDYGYGSGFRLFGGFGIGRGVGIGVGGSFGPAFGQQPVEVERVSLLARDGHLRISRDIRRFDHLGELRESYSASNDDFCRRFQETFEQTTSTQGAS